MAVETILLDDLRSHDGDDSVRNWCSRLEAGAVLFPADSRSDSCGRPDFFTWPATDFEQSAQEHRVQA